MDFYKMVVNYVRVTNICTVQSSDVLVVPLTIFFYFIENRTLI